MKTSKFPNYLFVFFVFILTIFPGCAPSPSDPAEKSLLTSTPITPVESPTITPTLEPTPVATEKATYELYFNATWSVDTHPGNYDPTAHFSPFIVCIFDGTTEGKVFIPNELASEGMEQMAETGATDLLEGEIGNLITSGSVEDFIRGQRFDSPGVDSGVLALSQTFSHVLFVSMIAPSPDWFVAADVALFSEGQWVDQINVPVLSYDSGTDSGETLTAVDINTDPAQPITLLEPDLQNMGTLELVRIDQ